jgi:hypothetical protein
MGKQRNKGGRPTKGDDARQHLVTVRICKADLDELLEVQKLTRKSKSNIFYDRYKNNKFNYVEISTYPITELRQFRIANDNLNQIAKMVNTYKEHSLNKDLIEALRIISMALLRIQP